MLAFGGTTGGGGSFAAPAQRRSSHHARRRDRLGLPHAHRHGPQGHARRRERVRPRSACGHRSARAKWRRGRRCRRHRARRGAPGRRRHRPLRRDRDRPRARARCGAQPPLRVGDGGGADSGRQHPRRHGRSRDRRRRRVAVDLAHHHEARTLYRRVQAVDVAEPSRDARRPCVRHVDHRGVERGEEGRRHPRADGLLGVHVTPAGARGDRRRALRGRDLPDRGAAA